MRVRCAAVKQYHSSILRYKLATLLRCAGRSFLASPRKEPKKATWGRRSDCAVVTLLHFGTTPDSPNSPSPKTPSPAARNRYIAVVDFVNSSTNFCFSNCLLLPKSTFSIEEQATEKSCHSEEGVSPTWESVPKMFRLYGNFV